MNSPLNEEIRDLFNSTKFTPRNELTNTHRNVVDDHIYSIMTWKIRKTKYFLTTIGYILSFGILYILTYYYHTLIITLYCEETTPENCDYVVITDFSNSKYICPVIHQKFHEVHPVFKKSPHILSRLGTIKSESPYLNKNLDEAKKEAFGIIFFFKNVKYQYKNGEFAPVYFNLCKYTNEELINIFYHEGKKYYYLNSNDNKEFMPNLSEYNYLLNKYGVNELIGESKNIFSIFLRQFFNLLNLYSLFCVLIWIINAYYFFAFLILLFSLSVLIYATHNDFMISRKIYDIKKKTTTELSDKSSDFSDFLSQNKEKDSFTLQQEITSYREINKEINSLISNINEPWSIVPGEVIRIKANHRMEFDGVILSGYCTVDESELTGETNEVYKTQLPNNKKPFKYSDTNHFLFQGTLIKQCVNEFSEDEMTVLVLNTGMNTSRANLLLNLSFPKTGNYSFYQDVWIFAGIMFCFWLISVIFIICMGLTINLAFDSLTIILPPTLFISLSYSTHCYKRSLRRRKIKCVDKDKITAAGKANIIVLDKTGTLTEDKFELYGYQFAMPKKKEKKKDNPIILSNVGANSKILNTIHEEFWRQYNVQKGKGYLNDPKYNIIYFTECLGCCHGIDKFGDKNLGDAIDKKIFESMKWMIQNEEDRVTKQTLRYIMPSNLYKITEKSFFDQIEQNIEKITQIRKEKSFNKKKIIINQENPMQYKILIEKIYNFSSETQSMSVIVKNILDNTRRIFVKGAPEKILDKCTKESKPEGINKRIMELTRQGLRVIACSTRVLKEGEYCPEKQSDYDKEINPIEKEKNMTFLGLVIFKNPLKHDTKNVIKKLTKAQFKIIMSTGDNECTSYYVAQQSHMINNSIQNRYVVEVQAQAQLLYLKEQAVYNEYTNDESEIESSFLVQPSLEDIEQDNNLYRIKDILKQKQAIVSVSGSALTFILNQIKKKETNFIDNSKTATKKEVVSLLRKFGVIYYRMTPKNKAELIEFLKSDKHSIVIMCGDGSNDIPAILEADIGIALNQKSNLQVLSHFYMNNSSIQCVETIVKTGRACFESNEMIFKCMVLSGLIQIISLLCLKSLDLPELTLREYLYIDLVCIMFPSLFASQTTPAMGLAKEAIGTSMLNKKFIISVMVQIIAQISLLIGFFFFLIHNVDYKGNKVDPNSDTQVTVFGSYIFLFTSFQYLTCNFVFNSQSLHRKHFFSNSTYLIFLFFGTLLTLLFVTIDKFQDHFFNRTFVSLEGNSKYFEYTYEFNKFILQVFVVSDVLVGLIFEWVVTWKIQ